jgi:hypothetical protein
LASDTAAIAETLPHLLGMSIRPDAASVHAPHALDTTRIGHTQLHPTSRGGTASRNPATPGGNSSPSQRCVWKGDSEPARIHGRGGCGGAQRTVEEERRRTSLCANANRNQLKLEKLMF